MDDGKAVQIVIQIQLITVYLYVKHVIAVYIVIRYIQICNVCNVIPEEVGNKTLK